MTEVIKHEDPLADALRDLLGGVGRAQVVRVKDGVETVIEVNPENVPQAETKQEPGLS